MAPLNAALRYGSANELSMAAKGVSYIAVRNGSKVPRCYGVFNHKMASLRMPSCAPARSALSGSITIIASTKKLSFPKGGSLEWKNIHTGSASAPGGVSW